MDLAVTAARRATAASRGGGWAEGRLMRPRDVDAHLFLTFWPLGLLVPPGPARAGGPGGVVLVLPGRLLETDKHGLARPAVPDDQVVTGPQLCVEE
jgi:hypothetical protein